MLPLSFGLRDSAFALHLRHPFGILQSILRLQSLAILEVSQDLCMYVSTLFTVCQ